MIIPLVILVVVGIIQVTTALYGEVDAHCRNHSAELASVNEGGELGDFVRKVDFMKGLYQNEK